MLCIERNRATIYQQQGRSTGFRANKTLSEQACVDSDRVDGRCRRPIGAFAATAASQLTRTMAQPMS